MIMKLLVTVQSKNGERPSDPMLIDANGSDFCLLVDNFLRTGDNVLIFQSVSEYKAAPSGDCPCVDYPCVGCDKKE